MESSLRMVRMIRLALLASIVAYVFIGERVAHPPATLPNVVLFYVFGMVAITTVGVIVAVRRSFIQQSEARLATEPADAAAQGRWRTGFMISYVLSESIALYGLILRILGFTLSQVAPFYVVGFILLLFYRPRSPSNEK